MDQVLIITQLYAAGRKKPSQKIKPKFKYSMNEPWANALKLWLSLMLHYVRCLLVICARTILRIFSIPVNMLQDSWQQLCLPHGSWSCSRTKAQAMHGVTILGPLTAWWMFCVFRPVSLWLCVQASCGKDSQVFYSSPAATSGLSGQKHHQCKVHCTDDNLHLQVQGQSVLNAVLKVQNKQAYSSSWHWLDHTELGCAQTPEGLSTLSLGVVRHPEDLSIPSLTVVRHWMTLFTHHSVWEQTLNTRCMDHLLQPDNESDSSLPPSSMTQTISSAMQEQNPSQDWYKCELLSFGLLQHPSSSTIGEERSIACLASEHASFGEMVVGNYVIKAVHSVFNFNNSLDSDYRRPATLCV